MSALPTIELLDRELAAQRLACTVAAQVSSVLVGLLLTLNSDALLTLPASLASILEKQFALARVKLPIERHFLPGAAPVAFELRPRRMPQLGARRDRGARPRDAQGRVTWLRSGRLKHFLLLALLLLRHCFPSLPALRWRPSQARSSATSSSPCKAKRSASASTRRSTLLNIPSASLALIDEGRIAFARAYGKDATPETLYQAASLSKFVAAIGAMRLVDRRHARSSMRT